MSKSASLQQGSKVGGLGPRGKSAFGNLGQVAPQAESIVRLAPSLQPPEVEFRCLAQAAAWSCLTSRRAMEWYLHPRSGFKIVLVSFKETGFTQLCSCCCSLFFMSSLGLMLFVNCCDGVVMVMISIAY